MNNYNQHQAPPVTAPPAQGAYPTLAQSYPVQAMHASAYTAPPPAGYPTNETVHAQQVSTKTTSRGDGFWKGCCAALCCCCLVDMCF
ncbi:hypothetical protein LUZ63_006593 [Rhynchospora breviuscula]|uniref:Cysteine-rich transmembrane domain-containing protein n=1 Tax=Rhynchospora breviuscula TaxID=2022672 RepID=A0A9Q0HTP5_9POAL|nr:hypothetical protein LUZ63_006593 [Rhynchospora breviuscula]